MTCIWFGLHRGLKHALPSAEDASKHVVKSSDKMITGCQTCLCVLCKYIMKPPKCPQSGFAWHRDSDWCSPDAVGERTETLYLSLWCALDDMTSGTELQSCMHSLGCCNAYASGCKGFVLMMGDHAADNGCLHIWSNAGGSELPHSLQDLHFVGQPLPVEAGTAVVMGDRLMHCSLPNNSHHPRRAWMPQYSQQPILSLSTDYPVTLAVPLS